MGKVAPVIFPVDAALAVSAFLKLLSRKLLPSPDLLLGLMLPSGPGMKLLPFLGLLPAMSALPPRLNPLPGLLAGLVMMIETPVLSEEPTIRTIRTFFSGVYLVAWTPC